MLHLLPLRSIGRFAITVTILAVVALIFIGSPAEGTAIATAMVIVRRALSVEAGLVLITFYFWYRVPGLTKRWLFPHIAGNWDGTLRFKRKVPKTDTEQERLIEDSRQASLYVHQSLVKIRLILETEESSSETLVVHSERDPDFSRFRLFYIFENRSRDGLPNTARSYRGTAVMEVPPGTPDVLNGTYFTDQGSEGTFRFERRPLSYTGWRGIWHSLVGEKGAAKPIAGVPRDDRALEF